LKKNNVSNTANLSSRASPPPPLLFPTGAQADPVKQCGPLALTELHILWEKGAIDRDTFVWCVA